MREDDVVRLRDAMRRLGDTPHPHGSKKLSGYDGLYRIRVGDYRVIYEVEDERILDRNIGHRREVYR